MSKFLIFIPCYRCENQIERVVYKLKESKIEASVLLIDNISPDHTLKKAQAALDQNFISPAVILKNRENYNLGGSHKVAFNYALEHGFSHVIVLHGDDQADLRDLIPLIEAKYHLEYDCLLGSRFHPDSRLQGYSKFRIFGNKVLNLFCSLVCSAPISDMGSGLNMYSAHFLKDARYLSFPNDLTFNVSLLFHSYLAGYKVSFFPISWREEDQVSNAKIFTQMKIILSTIIKVLKEKSSLYSGPTQLYASEVIYKK
jgi:glycosyltransferase involved in cell wall biosynthesis